MLLLALAALTLSIPAQGDGDPDGGGFPVEPEASTEGVVADLFAQGSLLASLEPDDRFGHAVELLADDAGAGLREYAVSATRSGMNAHRAGRVYLVRAHADAVQADGAYLWAQDLARLTLAAAEPRANFGAFVLAVPGEGGGAAALVVGAPTAQGRRLPMSVPAHHAIPLWTGDDEPAEQGARIGRVYVFAPSDGRLVRTLAGRPGDFFGAGARLVEDLDGDGAQDIEVGALFLDDAFNVRLRRQVFSSLTGALLLDQEDAETAVLRLAADLNDDGVVDAQDLGLMIMLMDAGVDDGVWLADLNGDGVVDAFDLALLLEAFGREADDPEAASVLGINPTDCFLDKTKGKESCDDDLEENPEGGPEEETPDGGGGGGGGDDPDGEGPDGEGPGGEGPGGGCTNTLQGPWPGPPMILQAGKPYTFSLSTPDTACTASWPNHATIVSEPFGERDLSANVTFPVPGLVTLTVDCNCPVSHTYRVMDMDVTLDAPVLEHPEEGEPAFSLLFMNQDQDYYPLVLDGLLGGDASLLAEPKWVAVASSNIRIWYRVADGDLHATTNPGGDPPLEREIDGEIYRPMPQTPIPGILPEGRTLLVEGLYPSHSLANAQVMVVQLGLASITVDGESIEYNTTLLRYFDTTVAEVRMHDLRRWGPEWDPATDAVTFESNDALDSSRLAVSQVGGAITDGASICLVRLVPEALASVPGASLGVRREGHAYHNRPGVVGALVSHDPAAGLAGNIPPLPLGMEPLNDGFASTAPIPQGSAFYIPPPNYIDAQHNPQEPLPLDDGEVTRMRFEFVASGQTVGSSLFRLRRPPIVLVHGLWGSPATWDRHLTPWHDTPGTGFETRLYRVDYEDTHDAGYDENWKKVPQAIDAALNDYHSANDGSGHHPDRGFLGTRYAATRADVVGHSMGGMLSRLYISDYAGSGVKREKRVYKLWPLPSHYAWEPDPDYAHLAISVARGLGNPPLEWDYLTHRNYGAGSIRRFVSIGTPFDGSDWARVVSKHWVKTAIAGDIGEALLDDPVGALQRFHHNQQNPPMGLIVPMTAPRALIDLTPDSTMQREMDAANYPAGRQRVLWHPVVSAATQQLPPTLWVSAMWHGIVALPNAIADGAASTANGTKGDLIVLLQSQSNGQLEVTNPLGTLRAPFTSTIHAPIPGMQEFSVINQTASQPVADRVKRLIGTKDPADWVGELQP